MKQVFAVFGDPISHSLSPPMHNAAYKALGINACYHAFKVTRENLEKAIHGARAMGFGGINLTIPHKEKALEYVKPDPIAEQIGAINTIDFKKETMGYNTDGIGAKKAIESTGITVKGKKILLLGAGGAARAIAFQLATDGTHTLLIANRTIERAQKLAEHLSNITQAEAHQLKDAEKIAPDADILINTTPIGMHPKTDETPLPATALQPNHVVFDIVYNPLKTRLLKNAENTGAAIITGEKMLLYQGAEAFKIWTGIKPPIEVMHTALLRALGDTK